MDYAFVKERTRKINMVRDEAKSLLKEFANELETSKPMIVSDLKEYGHEIAGIIVEDVKVWDNGSIDLHFGPMLSETD